MEVSRRKLVVVGATLGIAGLAGLSGGLAKEPGGDTADKEEKGDEAEHEHEEEVSPAEDLMREHGALERILLIYGESLRRLRSNQDLPPKAVADAAAIVRSFVEDYHEKLEEDYLFPRFKKANKLVDLVDVLLQQHQAGRRLTDTVLRLSTAQGLKSDEDRKTLANTLRLFIRMYNPHAAREDTVLFPAFRGLVSAHEYDSLGEEFEEKEHQLFGDDGFGKMVDRIASIEKSLGIYDLAQFTPRGRPMAATLMRRLLATTAPGATILVRLMVGGVFLSEGIQKFLYPDALAVGRFAKIGIPSPEIMGPFVGVVEIVCGGLVLLGLFTRLAAIPLLINISVAILSTKVPILLGHGYWIFSLPKASNYGFWGMMHEARTDFSMWLGLVFLLIVGAGSLSFDILVARRLAADRER